MVVSPHGAAEDEVTPEHYRSRLDAGVQPAETRFPPLVLVILPRRLLPHVGPVRRGLSRGETVFLLDHLVGESTDSRSGQIHHRGVHNDAFEPTGLELPQHVIQRGDASVGRLVHNVPVSYTHLTLPTKRIV